MSKWFWVILAIIVVALVGLFALGNRSSENTASDSTNAEEITEVDHVRGPSTATVTLVEYGDLQCPACGAAYPFIKQLEDDYPDNLRVVFRHFPLTAIHPNAFAAARATEAAAAQGKFFEMHDLLYERQSQWTENPKAAELFRDYAEELGLDLEVFNDTYNSSSTTDRINRDIKLGQSLDVSATPTFYINGKKIESNPRSYEEFKAQIEAALNANS